MYRSGQGVHICLMAGLFKGQLLLWAIVSVVWMEAATDPRQEGAGAGRSAGADEPAGWEKDGTRCRREAKGENKNRKWIGNRGGARREQYLKL